MAYATKFFFQFKNRQEDVFTVLIKQKDYAGYETELEAADNAFTLQYQSGDGDIFNPIRPSEATIEFWNIDTDNTYELHIGDFYSDDDTAFKLEFYDVNNNLLWSGFLQLDNSAEDMQDYPHIISLNWNDNLGLLDQLAIITDTTLYGETFTIAEVMKLCLDLTNLELELDAYLNIFENTTDDRSDDPTADFMQQTIIYKNTLLTSDTEFKKANEVLTDICNTFRMQLFQANGVWNLIRQGELRLFTDAQVPGTKYSVDFLTKTAITMDAKLGVGFNLDILPINENQQNRILRPLQYSKKTFNYSKPEQLIRNANLQELGDFISTSTSGGFTYDKYDVPSYWVHRDGGTGNPLVDESYIVVKSNSTTGEEVERYVYDPLVTGGPQVCWLQLAAIPVTAGDLWNFTVQWRTPSDVNDPLSFFVRFDLFTPGCGLVKFLNPNALADDKIVWNAGTGSAWPNDGGIRMDITAGTDSSQYQTYDLSSLQIPGYSIPAIPNDGILVIAIAGDNNGNGSIALSDMIWKEPSITFSNNINNNTNITGQYSKQSQTSLTKNVSEVELVYDDSPRNTIDGTLYTNALSDFSCVPLSDIALTRTATWHRAEISEAWKLQQIQAFDELFIQRKVRTIVEGDWYGLSYLTGGSPQVKKFISLLNSLQINFLTGMNFLFGIATFDFMKAQFTATLYEVWDDGEDDADLANTYEFKYIYENK